MTKNRRLKAGLFFAASWLSATEVAAQAAPDAPSFALPNMVVTATGRPEAQTEIASTVQVISQETIRRSPAKSLTDLLTESGVAFFSDWTAGQTSIGMRGARTDGQGKDFAGQILVLVNGRRAGTANLSKLSPNEVERIEIVRGPASVIYGSQAIGGVINLIMKDGRSTKGSQLRASTGSWGLADGHLQTGGTYENKDYYIGFGGTHRDSYEPGKNAPESPLSNTAYDRYGGSGALGFQIDDLNRIDFSMRSDGIYDAGFRGSAWNIRNREDRQNASIDANWEGSSRDGAYKWNLHGYLVRDSDDFDYSNFASNLKSDHNQRELSIVGIRAAPEIRLSPNNDLLTGLDLETSWVNSTRTRSALTGTTAQVAPQDNNFTERVMGLYAEDVQHLFKDTVTLRGGLRGTFGWTDLEATPNNALRLSNRSYDALTYSAGGTWQVIDPLTLRAGVSTGFRAPTATELGANFTTLAGSQIFGNSGLRPEQSLQFEVGATATGSWWRLDAALFQNTIEDRITTQTLSTSGTTTTSRYINSTGDAFVQGLELQAETDFGRLLGMTDWTWRGTMNGSWNFTMDDKGAVASANYRQIQRMYEYQGVFGTIFGQRSLWDFGFQAILRGPMYYDTEESLLIPQGEPNSVFVHRADAFWIFNARANYYMTEGFTLWGAMNNILDKNYSPIFVALDKAPYISNPAVANGGRGNSAPGREFLVGGRLDF